MAVSIKTKQGVNIRTGNEICPDVEVYCKSTDTKPIQGMRNADTLLDLVLISEGK